MIAPKQAFSLKRFVFPLTTLKAVHLLIIIGLIVYSNSLFNGFAGDDFGQLVDNVITHSVANIPRFFLGSSFNNGNGGTVGIYYKPLMMTFFSVIYSLFGPQAFFFHLFQVILHICNSVFVFLLFRHFYKKELSFLLGLVFLIHPINNEAVVYVSNLQDVLFFFFGILSLLFSIRSYSLKNFILSIIFFSCSLLSKETGIVFGLIVLLYSFLYSKQHGKKYLLSLPIILLIYFVIHVSVVGIGFSNNQPFPIMRLSFFERLLNIPLIIYFYITTFIFPKDLALGYQGVIKDIRWNTFYFPLFVDIVFALLLTIVCIKNIRNQLQYKIFLFFTILIIIGMVMHIQIIPLDFVVSERWFYLPIVGLLGIIGFILSNTKIYMQKYHFFPYVIVIILLSALSYRTFIRNYDWKNGLTLAEHDTQIVKNSYSLYAYYGTELYNIGRYDEAMNMFKKSIDLAPYWYLNWNYLGLTQERKGSLLKDRMLISMAEVSYIKSINNSDSDIPSVNYSRLLVYYYDAGKAKQFIELSLKKYPNSSGLWYNYALLNLINKNTSQAKISSQNAYMLNPNNNDAKILFNHLATNTPVTIQKTDF